MSLLMDALRKAEQEKKEAAKRLREHTGARDQPGDDQSGGLALALEEPVSTDRREETTERRVIAESGEESALEFAGDVTTADKSDPDLALSPLATGGDVTATGGTAGGRSGPHQAADSGDLTIEDKTVTTETTRADLTAPGQWTISEPGEPTSRTDENERPAPAAGEGAAAEFEETLQDTTHGARISDATQPATVGQRLATGSTGRHDSPVTAHNVFAARGKTSNYTLHAVVALLLLTAVAAISYGVFTYYTITPVTRDLPSPMVARGIEQVEAPPMMPVPEHAADEISAPAVAAPVEAPDEPAETVAMLDSPAAADTGKDAEQQVAAVAPEPVAVEEPGHAPPAPADAAVMHPADAADMLELKPALLRISRSQPVERDVRAVNEAWHAYREGHYDIARRLYGEVLAADPEQRDALLGMAAIAMRRQQPDRAFDYYMRVLRLNPADRVAQTALIGLQGHIDPVASESRVRLLLEQTPDAPYLHFTLGNLYAAQSRWPEAQRAFFEAYRRDSGNPDYALNLAVSLDRLGQPRAAGEYYRRALELADGRNVNFDTIQVSTRLQALSAVLNP